MSRASVRDTPEAVRASLASTTGVDEYLPKWVTANPTAVAESVVRSTTNATVRSATSDGSRHELTLSSTGSATVELALHDFPGWSVKTLAGPEGVENGTSARGLVELRLPSAGEYRLAVVFGDSPVRRAAALVSLLTALTLVPLLRWALGLVRAHEVVPSSGRRFAWRFRLLPR
jgi:hypothetical protein